MASPVNSSDVPVPGWDRVLSAFGEHWPGASHDRLTRALEMARLAHEGQFRKSGEPYIIHPVAVAVTIAELGMDEDSICAALLHDVIEDTPVTADDVEAEFGKDVRHMTEGVTKLQSQKLAEASVSKRARAENNRAAESLRKLLLAMAEDRKSVV